MYIFEPLIDISESKRVVKGSAQKRVPHAHVYVYILMMLRIRRKGTYRISAIAVEPIDSQSTLLPRQQTHKGGARIGEH